jgi:glycosyltransferase involved in cell wall biosynthesis
LSNKICVLPNDSLYDYFRKGEIKYGYFNPCNFFDEIHVISLFDDEIDDDSVKELAGNATIKIHKIGKVNLSNYKRFYDEIFHLINKINPSLIRAYNPLIQGWLATKIAKKLEIPVIISVHTNYDEQRKLLKKQKKIIKFFKLQFTAKKIEKYVLEEADAVICVYQHIVPYVKKMGANNIHVKYNKVNFEHFSPEIEKKIKNNKPTIISVGRLIDQKNQMYLLEAIKNINANLLLIGDGPNFNILNEFIQENHIKDKVNIIRSIPNKELGGYYTSCDIYAQVLENLEGVPIPVLEAMACGLPVVMSNHDTSYSEIIDDAVIFSKNSGVDFAEAFKKLLSNPKLREQMKKKSLEVINNINGEKMERKELELYHSLIKTRKERI